MAMMKTPFPTRIAIMSRPVIGQIRGSGTVRAVVGLLRYVAAVMLG